MSFALAPLLDRDGRPAAEAWRFAPGVAYLNHAAFGAVPTRTQRRQQRLRRQMDADPAAWFRALEPRVQTARLGIGAALGTDPERTALVSNASAAATVALSALHLRPGAEILMTDDAYGAVLLAAHRAARRAGATVRLVHLPLEAPSSAVADAIVRQVREGTAALVLDQVASSTFRMLPAAEVAQRVRPVPVIVDGAHAAGLIPDAPTVAGGAVWFGNLHKFLCAPRACAALVLGDAVSEGDVLPTVASWNEQAPFPARFDLQGTGDDTALLSAPDALADLDERFGWDRIRRHADDVACEVRRHLPTAAVGAPASGAALVPLIPGLADTGEQARALAGTLAEHGVEVAVTVWGGRGFARITGHAYTTARDLERAVDLLAPLAAEP